jgi:hypothetical protein
MQDRRIVPLGRCPKTIPPIGFGFRTNRSGEFVRPGSPAIQSTFAYVTPQLITRSAALDVRCGPPCAASLFRATSGSHEHSETGSDSGAGAGRRTRTGTPAARCDSSRVAESAPDAREVGTARVTHSPGAGSTCGADRHRAASASIPGTAKSRSSDAVRHTDDAFTQLRTASRELRTAA